MIRKTVRTFATMAIVTCAASAAAGERRYALIVSGAAGGSEYAGQYDGWSAALSTTLVENVRFDPQLVTVLSDTTRTDAAATAANVRRAIGSIRGRMTRDDLLLVVLIGHGTFDGTDAKFNLVGPDLESAEWAALLRPLPGRLVFVNTSAASFPFVERLGGPRRIVITATDSAAQRFDTMFPEYFIHAFSDEAADIDKNGRVSIWEAFSAASAGVRRHYQQRGQLSAERALLDDTGDGVGKDAADPGDEGALASRTYLDESLPGAAPTDEVLIKLLQRRSRLEADADDLRIRRQFLPAAEYRQEFERLMVELAKVSQEIRARTKT
ncbi:MAG: hypothetical protein ABI818_07470 [Acidobacteriota bacterium]